MFIHFLRPSHTYAQLTEGVVRTYPRRAFGRKGSAEMTRDSDDTRMEHTRRHIALLPGFARLALDCVHRPYPNKIGHVMLEDADARPPRELTPAFYGCFDWHSAVHGHWLLARTARVLPAHPIAHEARQALGRSLTAEALAGELAYVQPRRGFERPYGLAWLLALDAELNTWEHEEAQGWAELLAPLANVCWQSLAEWLPRLSHPIRSGVHSQTAFAMGLALDWARAVGHEQAADLLRERALALHGGDRDVPLHLEPSGEDFLSPALGAADLLRRVMEPSELARWLTVAMPALSTREPTLRPVTVSDPTDGRLAHLDGLNLSRAWMLRAVASSLPDGDPRTSSLSAMANAHADAGVAAVSDTHYEGSHWLGTFAAYMVTNPGA